MFIAVVGATGGTGVEVLRQAHARGHRVRALVRNPAKLATRPEAPAGADLSICATDVSDRDGVTAALTGVDAVVSCLGWSSKGDAGVIADGVRSVLAGMELTGVRRLVTVSASGMVVDGDDPLGRYLAKPILKRVLREEFADMTRMEQAIRGSGTDWTIIRPPRLQDGQAKGYRERRDGNVRWRYTIRRADAAAAVLDALEDPSAIGAAISIAN